MIPSKLIPIKIERASSKGLTKNDPNDNNASIGKKTNTAVLLNKYR
ncbi:hypothetical protein VIBNISFn118_2120002 [Vibrio nigripulchritudo SFn118]|nr:hypothetical protein VIBNISFn118_2120002 [Vibrio nigripulchritudo SFn118]